MFFRHCHVYRLLWSIIIIAELVSSYDVKKAVNAEVTFTPVGSLAPGTTSIIWKHTDNAGIVVKVIDWDREDDSTEIPNPKFKTHASLNKNTGELTLKHLQLKHSGKYIIEINSKEQARRYSLTVIERVSKPYISQECLDHVCNLRCDGHVTSGSTITWKNSAGETLNEQYSNMRSLVKVTNSSNPDNYYTCTFKNEVSEDTSDPVYERDLFGGSNKIIPLVISISIIIIILIIVVATFFLFRCNTTFYWSPSLKEPKERNLLCV